MSGDSDVSNCIGVQLVITMALDLGACTITKEMDGEDIVNGGKKVVGGSREAGGRKYVIYRSHFYNPPAGQSKKGNQHSATR
jgi:hypothetical protein